MLRLSLGTPEYANCRAQIAYQRGMVNAGMQAQLQRENAELMARNRQQTCFYNGSTFGRNTSGSIWCP